MLTSSSAKTRSIEEFLEKKFDTTFESSEITLEPSLNPNLGTPDRIFSDDTAHEMMLPISLKELEDNIKELKSGKAEGIDGITNEMIKNTGPLARKMILEMFNNVMTGAQIPSDWKIGDIVLILKKPPRTDINNYRPITLISCVSKLLTKILAKRVSTAVGKEDIIGPEQSGFRPHRSCSDNIFILNSIREFNKSKKLLSYLLFIDLKEAYDRVDRGILLAKLAQLNFPDSFLSLLRNYYFQDNVSSTAGGERSRPQFQKRGLRQGCNLSAILFIIYLSELGRRMRLSGRGVRLPSGELVYILLFADDIIIVSNLEADLLILKSIIELWCRDFGMKISATKSSIIATDVDISCTIVDLISGETDYLGIVNHYKYLGIVQHLSPLKTAKTKGISMVEKARRFKDIILRTSFSVLDKIQAASAVWCNVALPAILYGTDAVPILESTVNELEMIQNKLGKALMNIPPSSANPIINTELGWKPIRLRIAQSKLAFFKRCSDKDFKGNPLVKTCMEWNQSVKGSLYMTNLIFFLSIYSENSDFSNLNSKMLCSFHEDEILAKIQLLPSLKLLRIPHLLNSRWSSILSRFKVSNAGLGNRDAYRTADAVLESGGRVTLCPICLNGPNNEIHLLLHCEPLGIKRKRIYVSGNISLETSLEMLRKSPGEAGDEECIRNFLGKPGMQLRELVDRGLALDILLDEFFLMWSNKSGKTIDRRVFFNYV